MIRLKTILLQTSDFLGRGRRCKGEVWRSNADQRRFIIGGPDDAESVKWAKKMTDMHGIPCYGLPVERKNELVTPEFVEAIAGALLEREWEY